MTKWTLIIGVIMKQGSRMQCQYYTYNIRSVK